MNALINIFGICYQEIRSIIRDKGIMIFILFVPLVYPLLYSYVYTNEVVQEVPVAVVDNSNSALSRQFIREVDSSPDVSIVAKCSNLSEAQELVRRQDVYGIIEIPSSLTNDLVHGNQAYIGLFCDMSSMLYYKALLVSVTNVSLELNKNIKVNHYLGNTTRRQDEINKMPIEYNYVPLYNSQSGFAAFLIPPVLMLIIQQTLLLGIGMSMGNSREKYGRLVIPHNRWYNKPVSIVVGKTLPYLILYMLLAVYMFTAVTNMFTLPKLGHYKTFIIFVMPYILSCIFFAMVLAEFIYRREDSILLLVFMSVPILFLSGLSWPTVSMPTFWKYLSYLFPSTFGMNGYVRIASMGASLSEVRTEFFAIWLQVIVYFTITCLFYRRRVNKKAQRVFFGDRKII